MALPSTSSSGLEIAITDYEPNPYLGAQDTGFIISLLRKVHPKVMIEFGCHLGRTAAAILRYVKTLEAYYAIDVPSDYEPKLECQRSEISSSPGILVRDARFTLITRPRGSFDLSAKDLQPVNAAFIDGDHSQSAVLHDSRLAAQLMRRPGVIIWHDYGNPVVEVTAALDELHAEGWPITHIHGTWLAFCWFPKEPRYAFQIETIRPQGWLDQYSSQ